MARGRTALVLIWDDLYALYIRCHTRTSPIGKARCIGHFWVMLRPGVLQPLALSSISYADFIFLRYSWSYCGRDTHQHWPQSRPAFLPSPNMGHKVSVVHGVKSEDYYKSGNAINEIWLGRVELISRLPFGDSDLGQAGWSSGSFPKIPWHNFIIPLKKRRARREIGERLVDDTGDALASLVPVLVVLALVLGAYAVPIVLRRNTPSWERVLGGLDTGKRRTEHYRNVYAVRACIATVSLTMGLVVLAPWALQVLMDVRGLGLDNGNGNGSFLTFVPMVVLVISVLGFCYSAKAMCSLWVDWRRISRYSNDDDDDVDVEASSALVEENLPLIFLSVLERQRRA